MDVEKFACLLPTHISDSKIAVSFFSIQDTPQPCHDSKKNN